jgi:hypothetical protein
VDADPDSRRTTMKKALFALLLALLGLPSTNVLLVKFTYNFNL